MSKKNILEAIEGISDAIAERGGGGSASGGFTNVYYVEEESDVLNVYKNGMYVPFTLMDLIDEEEQLELPVFKTIPVLSFISPNVATVLVANGLAALPNGNYYLTFAMNALSVTFIANEENDYQFTVDAGGGGGSQQ